MKLRIGIWAVVGALVVVFWTIYITATSPTLSEITWALVYLTCPIALIGRHHALSFYFVLLVNGGTYAMIGSVMETLRRHYKNNQPRLLSN